MFVLSLTLLISRSCVDTHSISTIGFEDGFQNKGGRAGDDGAKDTKSGLVWNEKIRCPLMNMELLDVYSHNHSVDVQLGIGDDTVVQNIQFQSSHQVTSFVKCVRHMKLLIRKRAEGLAKKYEATTPERKKGKTFAAVTPSKATPKTKEADGSLAVTGGTDAPPKKGGKRKRKKKVGLFGFGLTDRVKDALTPKRWRDGSGEDDGGEDDSSDDIGDTTLPSLFGIGSKARTLDIGNNDEESSMAIDLLIEIVSATNLPVADIFSSDPFVVVRDGTKELHRTQVLKKK